MSEASAEKHDSFDPSLFEPEAIPPEVRAANEKMAKMLAGAPQWWEVGVVAYREAAASGKGPFPRPEKSAQARTIHVEGKGGHKIAVRVIAPERATGVYLFIHGGGLVFSSSDVQDSMLERVVKNTGMAALSIEYRLAPEHQYPAAWDDCESVGAWLVKNAQSEFGTSALTIGGESAGAMLAVAALLRLRDRNDSRAFRAVNLSYGNYDASMTPSQLQAPQMGSPIPMMGQIGLRKFVEAYLPAGVDPRDPDVSPLYADLRDMPAALFTVGTCDPLLDDSLFMHARWIAAGNEAHLAIYPGAPHAFTISPQPQGPQAAARIDAFLKNAIAG